AEQLGRVRPGRPGRLPDAGVVEDDHPEALRQELCLERPRRVVGAEPGDQQDGVAGAVLLVIDAALAEAGEWHAAASALPASPGTGGQVAVFELVVDVLHVANEVHHGPAAPAEELFSLRRRGLARL